MPGEVALVTGAGGFVGRHVISPLIAAGWSLHCAGRRRPHDLDPRAEWHTCDLLLGDSGAELVGRVRPAMVVHLAWETTPGHFWTAPENAPWLSASLRLIEAFAAAGGGRFVGIGSCAEYDWTLPGDAPWPETRPCQPATPYGRAKHALGETLQAMARQHGFSQAWVRLFHLFGPGEHRARLVPSVITALLADRPAPCGSGRPVRDFASSNYVARAIAAVAGSTLEGAVNVGSGQPLAIASLVQKLAELCDRPDLPRFGALPDRPDEPAYMVADVGRLRGETAFNETFDLSGELAATVDWWRTRLEGGEGAAVPPATKV